MVHNKKNWLFRVFSVIFQPKRFFSTIVADGNMEEAILRACLWGFIGGCLFLILRLITGDVFSISTIFKSIIFIPIASVIILFVASGLMMLVSEITSGERDWEITVKGLASISFVYPLILLLNSFAFNCASLWIISVLIDIYLIFLVYNIAVYCLHGKKISVLFIVALALLLLSYVYVSDYRSVWFMIKNSTTTLSCLF